MGDPIPKFPWLLVLNLADLHLAQGHNSKGSTAKVNSDWPMQWPMSGPGWPSQPLIAPRAIKRSPIRKLRVWHFATENPTPV